jgi:hypothetical protein
VRACDSALLNLCVFGRVVETSRDPLDLED